MAPDKGIVFSRAPAARGRIVVFVQQLSGKCAQQDSLSWVGTLCRRTSTHEGGRQLQPKQVGDSCGMHPFDRTAGWRLHAGRPHAGRTLGSVLGRQLLKARHTPELANPALIDSASISPAYQLAKPLDTAGRKRPATLAETPGPSVYLRAAGHRRSGAARPRGEPGQLSPAHATVAGQQASTVGWTPTADTKRRSFGPLR